MNKLITVLSGHKVRFALIAAFIAGVFVFAVVPALPNIAHHDTDGLTLSALISLADGGDAGDAGGDSGGDAGGGDAGDAGGGCCGGDTGGDAGDVGGGCCGGDTSGDPGSVDGGLSTSLACSVVVSSESVTAGDSVTVSWTTTEATSASISNIGTVALNGSRTVIVNSNTTYTLTAIGVSGSVSCAASVSVAPVVVLGPSCTLDATPSSVTSGQSSTLSWSTLNADTVTIDQGVGAVAQSGTRSVSPSTNTTYTLTATGPGGTATCVRTITVTPVVVPAPVCTLDATPSSVTSGQSSTLSWTTQNATQVSIDQNIGAVAQSGTRSVSPSTNTTYTLTATGAGGTVTCVRTVTVTPVVVNSPVCTLDVAPAIITRGASSTLSWTTQNANTVTIDQGVGAVAQSGTRSVSPSTNTTYTLTATGAGGTVTCVRTVTVEIPEDPLTCDAFTASPQTLAQAGTTTLAWSTTGATQVSINNGVGTVSLDGSKDVFVNANTTYTLTATRGAETRTCSVPVAIVPNVVVPRCDAFTASPTSGRNGTQATLTWQTTNATNVSIDQGIGSVSADGSRAITIDANRTYILTAVNGAATATCQASVRLETSGGGGGGGSNSPRCTLTASDEKIKSGEKVTLSWKNTRTDEIILKDNFGTKLVDTNLKADDTKFDEDADSIVVSPTKSTSYTLTAYKGSKKRVCTVDIQVENVKVTSTRSQDPLVAGISLSRVPYTGFDAGPFLTTVFYTLLILWALAVAYFLVIRREPVLGVSLGGAHGLKEHLVEDYVKSSEPAVIVPTITTPRVSAPEVSRMAYIPAVLTPPRVLPHGDMASKHAPVGYESLYEGYADESLTSREEEVATPTAVEIPNLPVGEPFAPTDDTDLLEQRAHEGRVLISTDALHFIQAQSQVTAERIELLDVVINAAKAHYPKEDGWVVVNKERIFTLLA